MYASAVGIDLGTTNTVVAILTDGNPDIIVNKQGCCVGTVAEDQSSTNLPNFCFDMKRIIGRSYSDIYVQNFVKKEQAKSWPLKIVPSEVNNEPRIQLECTNQSLSTKSPEDVSSDLLKYIKESIMEKVGTDIKDAVISVPAYFSYAQRAATKRAAEKAGFNVLKLITEPVAAAIQYTFKNKQKDGNLLMFDLGGGTLDLSIISIRNGNFTVKSIEGDIFLGGTDFDEKVFDYLRAEVGQRYNINSSTTQGIRFLRRLQNIAKRIKEMFATLDEYTFELEVYDGSDMHDCTLTMTREIFDKCCADLFKRINDKVKQCLQSANMTPKDINKVVLVGGSTRILKIREILTNMFPHVELSTDINQDEAVALGASIHAALIKNEISDNDRYVITDVAPFTIGIQSKYNLMTDFIKKGTKLPSTSSQILTTTENDQKEVVFEIFEGERKNCQLNNLLGQFSIKNLSPCKAGDVDFKVIYHLDENGVLTVTATEMKTGIHNQLQIEMQSLSLCSRTTFISFEEEVKLKAEDHMFEDFCQLRLRAETFCKQVLYDLDQANVTVGMIIKKQCKNFLQKINSLDYKEIEQLEVEFLKVMGNIKQLLSTV